MSSASYPIVTGSKKGIQLDPRTKLLLLLTITTLMFSTSNEGIMNLVKPLLSLVPFILILSERRFQTAAKYLILYAACFALERVALIWASGLPSFVLLAVTSIMTRFAPGIMMGAYPHLSRPGTPPTQADGKVAGPASPPYAPGVLHAGVSGPTSRLGLHAGTDL